MVNMARYWKMALVLALSLLLAGLAYVGSLYAQIKESQVDFEVMATVTIKKGDSLWNLAKKYYGDPLKWTYIKEMNKIANENRLSAGTVIYIPVKDAKKIVKKVEEEIVKKKTVEEELSEEIAKLREELLSVKAKADESEAKNKELTDALSEKDVAINEKDATIGELGGMLDNIKAGLDKMQAEAELEAQAKEMRAAALAAAERKSSELGESIQSKEERIQELESKLGQCRRDITDLERARAELDVRIREAEAARAKPPAPVTAERKSMVAAVAIALVGSIIWIASD